MAPSPIEPLLIVNTDEVAEWALRRVAGVFRPVPQQIVTVRKQRHGVRPVADLFLRDQLLYRVLTDPWLGQLRAPSQ